MGIPEVYKPAADTFPGLLVTAILNFFVGRHNKFRPPTAWSFSNLPTAQEDSHRGKAAMDAISLINYNRLDLPDSEVTDTIRRNGSVDCGIPDYGNGI